MREAVLSVEPREKTGSSSCHKLRSAGKIPAVVYGHGKPAKPVSLNELEFNRFLSHNPLSTLIRLSSEDEQIKGVTVMVKEIQRNPVRGTVMHVDLQEVSLSDKVTVTVPLVVTGRLADDHGILEHMLNEVSVEALPTQLPDHLLVDVTGLKIGDSLKVADIKVPEGVEVLDDPDEVVLHVSAPQVSEEAPAETEAEETEGQKSEGE